MTNVFLSILEQVKITQPLLLVKELQAVFGNMNYKDLARPSSYLSPILPWLLLDKEGGPAMTYKEEGNKSIVQHWSVVLVIHDRWTPSIGFTSSTYPKIMHNTTGEK